MHNNTPARTNAHVPTTLEVGTNPEHVSTKNKILMCNGLLDCTDPESDNDLNDWEQQFISSLHTKMVQYGDSFFCSEKQDFHLTKIWRKHFAA